MVQCLNLNLTPSKQLLGIAWHSSLTMFETFTYQGQGIPVEMQEFPKSQESPYISIQYFVLLVRTFFEGNCVHQRNRVVGDEVPPGTTPEEPRLEKAAMVHQNIFQPASHSNRKTCRNKRKRKIKKVLLYLLLLEYALVFDVIAVSHQTSIFPTSVGLLRTWSCLCSSIRIESASFQPVMTCIFEKSVC